MHRRAVPSLMCIPDSIPIGGSCSASKTRNQAFSYRRSRVRVRSDGRPHARRGRRLPDERPHSARRPFRARADDIDGARLAELGSHSRAAAASGARLAELRPHARAPNRKSRGRQQPLRFTPPSRRVLGAVNGEAALQWPPSAPRITPLLPGWGWIGIEPIQDASTAPRKRFEDHRAWSRCGGFGTAATHWSAAFASLAVVLAV